jgi:hypothetical protein
MRRLLIPAAVLVAVFCLMPPAWASITEVHTCKTYHSFNGNAEVKLCVYAYQDNGNDLVWVRATAAHVNGFQNPNLVNIQLRDWTSRNGSDPWCNGRAPGCGGGGNASVTAGIPIVLDTDDLFPSEHYCSMHGEADTFIQWPGGGTSSPDLNSPTTDTIGAGCILT